VLHLSFGGRRTLSRGRLSVPSLTDTIPERKENWVWLPTFA